MALPHGFDRALVDFASFVLLGWLASRLFRPPEFWQWVFFVLFLLLAVLFFLAWIMDLGAKL